MHEEPEAPRPINAAKPRDELPDLLLDEVDDPVSDGTESALETLVQNQEVQDPDGRRVWK